MSREYLNIYRKRDGKSVDGFTYVAMTAEELSEARANASPNMSGYQLVAVGVGAEIDPDLARQTAEDAARTPEYF